MKANNHLWIQYFDEFARHKLGLFKQITPLTRQILEVYIGIDALDCKDALSKVVSLHVRLYVHQLDISKVVRVLRPVLELETEGSSLDDDPTGTFTFKSLVSPKHIAGQKQLPNISSFVVFMLFKTFCEAAPRSTVMLTQCCKCYLGIVGSLFACFNVLGCYTYRNSKYLLCNLRSCILSTDVYTIHERGHFRWSHSGK